jgi:hypothetical protein
MDANVDPAAPAATANAELPCIQISRQNLQRLILSDGSILDLSPAGYFLRKFWCSIKRTLAVCTRYNKRYPNCCTRYVALLHVPAACYVVAKWVHTLATQFATVPFVCAT